MQDGPASAEGGAVDPAVRARVRSNWAALPPRTVQVLSNRPPRMRGSPSGTSWPIASSGRGVPANATAGEDQPVATDGVERSGGVG